jgi:hypothetical protein
MVLKYIGPFLRINSLTQENIEKQLFHYAKESLKHIVMNSKCGITTSINDLKVKNIPNSDISTFKKNSPLLCIYKKANPKMIKEDHSFKWDEDTFKKEIPINGNAYMTLSLLELRNYYEKFKETDAKLYSLGKIYESLSKNQLDFYSSNLRNIEGVFIDKKDISDNITGEYNFEEKDKKFKYSDQALLMAAFYNLSSDEDIKDGEAYKDFSLDIFRMFTEYQDELYSLSFEEINKVTLALNIFYDYSKVPEAKLLLINLCDLLAEKYNEEFALDEPKLEYICMLYINLFLLSKNTNILKFKETLSTIYNNLVNMYDVEKGIFLKSGDKKEIKFQCQEVVLYLMVLMLHSKHNDCDNLSMLSNIYKRQLVNSGLILSWPDSPTLDSAERYTNSSLKAEDLIEDSYFRLPTIATPESVELAPILIKSIEYNRKKETFSSSKATFDSTKNMPLMYMIIYFLRDK